MKIGKDGWTRKFKGTLRGGAYIYTYPGLTRAIVVNHNGVSFDGEEFRDLESAKSVALSTLTAGFNSLPAATPHLVDAPEATRLKAAAAALIADVRARYPGEELRCPFMIELDAAVAAA